ncbi:MAG: Uma2 family endonuclease [Chitinophagaceae bacterium]
MYTIYDDDKDEFQKVEEPDPSFEYTYADYLKWKFEERLELFRGRIYKLAAPTTNHQAILTDITVSIYNQIKNKKCRIFPAPFDVRLPVRNRKKDNEVNTVVQPDICVICDETKIDEKGCCGAPDLLIEILSPGNSRKEIRLKYELYEEAGVKEYWIVQPGSENVSVFVLNDSDKYDGAKMYANGDKIHSEAVRGLIINVNDIFTK